MNLFYINNIEETYNFRSIFLVLILAVSACTEKIRLFVPKCRYTWQWPLIFNLYPKRLVIQKKAGGNSWSLFFALYDRSVCLQYSPKESKNILQWLLPEGNFWVWLHFDVKKSAFSIRLLVQYKWLKFLVIFKQSQIILFIAHTL